MATIQLPLSFDDMLSFVHAHSSPHLPDLVREEHKERGRYCNLKGFGGFILATVPIIIVPGTVFLPVCTFPNYNCDRLQHLLQHEVLVINVIGELRVRGRDISLPARPMTY